MKEKLCSMLVLLALLSACAQQAPVQSAELIDVPSGMTWQEQYDLGMRYLIEGNYAEAIIAFTAAIEIDPKQAPAYVGRGQAYILSGETEENLTAAQADYEKAIELDDANPDAYLGLADVYIRCGDYDKALEILREGLEKTGQNPAIADKIAEMEHGDITDSSGKVRRMNYYSESGVLEWYHEFTYNVVGKRDSVTHKDSAGNRLEQIELVYDENDNELVSYYYVMPSGTLGRFEYEYNGSGQRVRGTRYNGDGAVEGYEAYQYDENGNQIRSEFYSPDGALQLYGVWEYNNSGLHTKESYYLSDGRLSYYFTYEYNSDGKTTRYNHYDGEGKLTQYKTYHYNERGKLSRTDTYDENGNLTSSSSYESWRVSDFR